jgi:hypothetical protein
LNFIFMLTQGDRTVPNCLDVLEEVADCGLTHIGFKDIGVDKAQLLELTAAIRELGAISYLEVVSETPDSSLASAEMAAELSVDRLLGGTEVAPTLEILTGTGIAYYPFPGRPQGHPTKLGGQAADIAADCLRFVQMGAQGVDLLAYRATEAPPEDLIAAARGALPESELIIAGSVASAGRIRDLAKLSVDGFTIGTAIFERQFVPEDPSLAAQVNRVLRLLT